MGGRVVSQPEAQAGDSAEATVRLDVRVDRQLVELQLGVAEGLGIEGTGAGEPTRLVRNKCRGRESNPHVACATRDFKSLISLHILIS